MICSEGGEINFRPDFGAGHLPPKTFSRNLRKAVQQVRPSWARKEDPSVLRMLDHHRHDRVQFTGMRRPRKASWEMTKYDALPQYPVCNSHTQSFSVNSCSISHIFAVRAIPFGSDPSVTQKQRTERDTFNWS